MYNAPLRKYCGDIFEEILLICSPKCLSIVIPRNFKLLVWIMKLSYNLIEGMRIFSRYEYKIKLLSFVFILIFDKSQMFVWISWVVEIEFISCSRCNHPQRSRVVWGGGFMLHSLRRRGFESQHCQKFYIFKIKFIYDFHSFILRIRYVGILYFSFHLFVLSW